MSGRVRVGVDVGGTFTDVVARSTDGGPLRLAKVPTTADPADALRRALAQVCRNGEQVASLTYGTTVVTNAVLEGRGARVALVTTRGFRDVLEIGRQNRDHLYRLDVPGRTPPPVPRALRFEVTERLDHTGRVLVPLDEAEVAALAGRLREAGVEAVAVCFLHAYADPAHERRTGAILRTAVPHVSLSSDINPEFREYERTQTTCVNAQLVPLVDRFLGDLTAGLAGSGAAALRLMQSNGGIAPPAEVRRRPLAMLFSGPAGGVAAARSVGADAGVRDAVAFDMGGTSTDVCLLQGGAVETLSERRISGRPVRVRSVAVESIGAGGGSIAWVDQAGALRVGPHSAGAAPGPACYGRGGTAPTVTDAYIVLGYLDAEGDVGGLRLDPDLAWRAVESVATRVALRVPEAAAGILEIANAAMSRVVRVVSVERGVDARGLTLIAYGGAGPMHAGRLIQSLGMPRALVPPYSGGFSAYGCLAADVRYDAARTARFDLVPAAAGAWTAALGEMERELLGRLAEHGLPAEQPVLIRSMDLRYRGQNYELEIEVPPDATAGAVAERFAARHRLRYGYATDEPVQGVALRASVVVPSAETGLPPVAGGDVRRGERTERRAMFHGHGWLRAAVHPRADAGPGRTIGGPAFVEDRWSTIVVYPGQTLRGDRAGLLWMQAA
ncbi:MAG TPA: hydantoinase/oxoprolinase family protein [bacterium]|nr:hydantoinase/oxoprolinase family protein [bacterium]